MSNQQKKIAMTDITDPKNNRQAGAMACLLALREAEKIAEEATTEVFFTTQERAVDVIKSAALPLSTFMQGFVSALAEYVFFINTTGIPDLYGWKPEAAMDEDEIKACRLEMTTEANNVVYLRPVS